MLMKSTYMFVTFFILCQFCFASDNINKDSLNDKKQEAFSKNAYKLAFEETIEVIKRKNMRSYIFRRIIAGKSDWTLNAEYFKNPNTNEWLSIYSIALNDTVIFIKNSNNNYFRIYVYKNFNDDFYEAKIKYVDILPKEKDEITWSIVVELDENDLEKMKKYGATFEIGNTGNCKKFVDKGFVRGFFDKIQSFKH